MIRLLKNSHFAKILPEITIVLAASTSINEQAWAEENEVRLTHTQRKLLNDAENRFNKMRKINLDCFDTIIKNSPDGNVKVAFLSFYKIIGKEKITVTERRNVCGLGITYAYGPDGEFIDYDYHR